LFFATYCETARTIVNELTKLDSSEVFIYKGIEYTPAKAAAEITNKTLVGMEFVKNYINGIENMYFDEEAFEAMFLW
jgi:hypothetical protein